MSFGKDESNIKLKSGHVKDAFSTLNSNGKMGSVVNHGEQATIPKGHFQGMAVRDSYAILTSNQEKESTEQGCMNYYAVGGPDKFFDLRRQKVADHVHPGGIQSIGSYIAVPLLSREEPRIEFYDYRNMELQEHLTLVLEQGSRPYCVGITDISIKEKERERDFYILCVGMKPEGNLFQFYRTGDNIPLSDRKNCKFDPNPFKRLEFRKRKYWYPNNISLLSDENGRLYFAGLHTVGPLRRYGIGRDWVDVFAVDISNGDIVLTEEDLKPEVSFHARCRGGGVLFSLFSVSLFKVPLFRVSFRWGASIWVDSPTSVRVSACEREARKGDSPITLNNFSP